MGNIVYVDETEVAWQYPPLKPGMKEGDPRVLYKRLLNETEGGPRVYLSQYEPGHEEPRHSHREGEVLYVLDGEANIEGTTLRPGMMVYVDGSTEYGPIKAGAAGLTFVRFAMPDPG
jgi:mannose-6-phosphate isomerase-like protein (cupin superfamily)